MPSPYNCRNIEGPEESGVYQIRNIKVNIFVLFGIGAKCRKRMKSFFPKPYGTGTRNNQEKRNYILINWEDLEYRTLATISRELTKEIEKELKIKKNHLFNT